MTDEKSILFDEHVLLGAEMAALDDTDFVAPLRYPSEELPKAADEIVYLSDLSGLPYGLLSGLYAQNVAEMTFAGKVLEVGECAFEPVLMGDGSLLGIPSLFRCGVHEYCVLDLLATNDACMEWVLALTQFKQEGTRLFLKTSFEDATDMLLPLFFWGSQAVAVLSDYLDATIKLPAPGQVLSCELDRIPALIAALPVLENAYVVLVPPVKARVLWRSFLSFSCVEPLGLVGLRSKLKEALDWSKLLEAEPKATAQDLSAYQLIRTNGQFVGMRGVLEG